MFYCKNCKSKSDSPICPTCGTPFTTADEIVNCPNCDKMFFKPSYDFACTRCGAMVKVIEQNPMQNQMNNGIMNQNQFMQPNIQSNVYNQQMPQQNGYNPAIQQGNGFNPNIQMGDYNQPMQQNNMGMQQPPYNNQQFVQPNMAQPQMQANQNIYEDQQNQNIEEEQKRTEQLASEYLNTNTDVNVQEDSNDDFLNLFSSSDENEDEVTEEVEKEGGVDFAALRSDENVEVSGEKVLTNDDGKMYDENGYEIVQASGSSSDSNGGKKSKKSKSSSSSSSEESGGKSGGGIKAFAWIEFILLLGCIVFIGYLTLGQYITTPDPSVRAWNEYINAQKIINDGTGSYGEEISQIKISDDGKYSFYKIAKEDVYIIFKISSGLKIGEFFNMSTAVVAEDPISLSEIQAAGYDDVKSYFDNYVATAN